MPTVPDFSGALTGAQTAVGYMTSTVVAAAPLLLLVGGSMFVIGFLVHAFKLRK